MLSEGRGRALARVRAVVLLACPNEGAEYLASIRAVTGFNRHPQAAQLVTLARDVGEARRIVLRQIINATSVDERQCRIPFFVYSGRTDNVVLRQSAQATFPHAEALPGDHFSVLDPDSPGSLTVETIKQHILDAMAADADSWPSSEGTDSIEAPPGDASSGNEFGIAVSAFVEADIDLDDLVDGDLTLQVDHSTGFEYAAATIVIQPSSLITFRARGLSIERRASQIVDGAGKALKVRVGTDTRANIPITDEQRRTAMGTADDLPGLIDVLTKGAHHSARAWAATRLGAIGDRRAVAPLMSVLDSVRPDQELSNEWVQSQAALALAELGDAAGAPAIQRALDQLPNRDHFAYMFEAALRDLPAAR